MKIINVVTGSIWANYWLAQSAAKYVKKYKWKVPTALNDARKFPKDAIIYFSAPHSLFAKPKNFKNHINVISAWWHGDRETPNKRVQERIDRAPEVLSRCKAVITACDRYKLFLESIGLNNVYKIPIGVDMELFKPVSKEKKNSLRKKFGIPEGKLCIGSFQRDTEKDGKPKKIKGPDIFLDVVEKLKNENIFVLLGGYRRDFIMKGLDKIGIPYAYIHEDKFENMPKMYGAIDVYLITSRVEGGPHSLTEAPSCGIPIVTTNCGMASDVIKEGKNGYLCKDISIMHEKVLLSSKISNTRKSIEYFDYETNVSDMYDELFDNIKV